MALESTEVRPRVKDLRLTLSIGRILVNTPTDPARLPSSEGCGDGSQRTAAGHLVTIRGLFRLDPVVGVALEPAPLRQNLAKFWKVWQPSGTVFGRRFCIGLMVVALTSAAGTAMARGRDGRQVHIVYEGQRLGSIAKRYNVSIEAICEANGIRRKDPIHPGQRLEIPSRDESREAASPTAASASAKAVSTTTPAAAETATASKVPALGQVSPVTDASKAPAASKISATKSASTPAATTASVGLVQVKTPAMAKAAAANDVALAKTPALAKAAVLSEGLDPVTLVPAGMSHRVKAGESLSAIAVQYQTNVKTLLAVNKLRKDQVIRVGQELVIPKAAMPATWWGRFARAPRSAGEIEVFAHTHRWKGKVVVKGKVQPTARAAISGLLGATGSAPPVPERLIQLLSHVSDTFGGRPVRLVSGYRTNSYVKDSRHRHSCAVDFSIPGVPNSAVRDYLLQLGNVGVGYYPNSTFVHLDVRARSAYWVDYAGPGEAPRKQPRADRRFAGKTNTKRKVVAGTNRRARYVAATPKVTKLDPLVGSGLDAEEAQPLAPLTSTGTTLTKTLATSNSPDT